jgi:hypothetical protein
VIKKEPNQLYGAVGTVEGLGIMRERVQKIPLQILNQTGVRRTRVLLFIANKLRCRNMS